MEEYFWAGTNVEALPDTHTELPYRSVVESGNPCVLCGHVLCLCFSVRRAARWLFLLHYPEGNAHTGNRVQLPDRRATVSARGPGKVAATASPRSPLPALAGEKGGMPGISQDTCPPLSMMRPLRDLRALLGAARTGRLRAGLPRRVGRARRSRGRSNSAGKVWM